MRVAAIALLALAALLLAERSEAGDFAPCEHDSPDDRGLRVLVQTVFDNDPNTQALQRMLGQPLTNESQS